MSAYKILEENEEEVEQVENEDEVEPPTQTEEKELLIESLRQENDELKMILHNKDTKFCQYHQDYL